MIGQGANMNTQDQAILLNQSANFISQSHSSAITSPLNSNNQNMLLLYNNQNGTKGNSNMIATESTHPNSEVHGYLQNQYKLDSAFTNLIIDKNVRRDLLLQNAKSLGNSLGTANKKTLNISHQGGAGLALGGKEREQSTLNDQQFFTLAKTGLLNNLNLS